MPDRDTISSPGEAGPGFPGWQPLPGSTRVHRGRAATGQLRNGGQLPGLRPGHQPVSRGQESDQVVPAQLLAWRLSVASGRTPGAYVHASKVTTRE